MELDKALSQLSEIHAQVLRTEIFQGYRAVTVGATSAVALLAATAQALWLRPDSITEFAVFWIAVAVGCATLCGADVFWSFLGSDRWTALRKTLRVVAQMLPALVAGAAATPVLLSLGQPADGLLPGFWAILFGLGIFASRPYLPLSVGWVGLYYVVAGVFLLTQATAPVPSPWSVGLCFGFGQALAAWVIYADVERGADVSRGGLDAP